MTAKKKEEPKSVKIETTNSVKAIVADCIIKKNNALADIRKLNENIRILDEKLNSVLISFMEGNGYMLEDYNIVEYCDHARYMVIEQKENKNE